MLKILENIKLARLEKSKNEIGSDNKNKFNNKSEISNNELKNNKVGNDKVVKKKNHWKIFIFKKTVILIILDFFTPRTRLTFTKLKQVFIKTLIFYYFHLKYFIQIKTNALEYGINKVFS